MITALVPGSFDPMTLGHLDLVRRAAHVSDRVIVAVAHNPNKTHLLDFATRCSVIAATLSTEGLSKKVSVEQLPGGLLVEGARTLGATHLVKGLRGPNDLAYEEPMARMNMDMAQLDTIFLLTNPQYAHVSSSLVREIYTLGANITPFVPPAAVEALESARTRTHEKGAANAR